MRDSTTPDGVFHPAFDTPLTPLEALQVIKAWGNPSVMTFSKSRCKACYEQLKPLFLNLEEE